jgi:hypothetical protein
MPVAARDESFEADESGEVGEYEGVCGVEEVGCFDVSVVDELGLPTHAVGRGTYVLLQACTIAKHCCSFRFLNR